MIVLDTINGKEQNRWNIPVGQSECPRAIRSLVIENSGTLVIAFDTR